MWKSVRRKARQAWQLQSQASLPGSSAHDPWATASLDFGPVAQGHPCWPSSHLDQGHEDQTQQALPFWVNFYLHRTVYSAKQTERKESQQDISSFLSS